MKKFRTNWLPITIIATTLFIIVIILAVFFFGSTITKSSVAAIYGYNNSKSLTREDTYKQFYSKGFEIGESRNHVSNIGSISIDNIKEKSDLEVLTLRDVVFICTDEDKKVWVQATGTGIFTVNLNAGEFIVDNNRHYVYIRIPQPELIPDSINVDKVENLLFEHNMFHGSISEGVHLAQKIRSDAKAKIVEDFTSNQDYYNMAKEAAVSIITDMVYALNSNVDDICVNVEFYN